MRADPVSNKLTLIGFIMDPVKVAEKLQKKSKKKVELISPKPNKDTKEKNEKKANDKTQTVVSSKYIHLHKVLTPLVMKICLSETD